MRHQATVGPETMSSPLTVPTFSLFDGDLVNRVFAGLGLRGRRVRDLAGRCGVLVGVTWIPVAILASLNAWLRLGTGGGFFLDFAAYLQFGVGLPLFVLAERVIGAHTREAAEYFVTTGVVTRPDVPAVAGGHRRMAALRHSMLPDLACVAVAYALSFATILPERWNALPTWHADGFALPKPLTAAGWWEMMVALPVLNYWWLRWIWKCALWTGYLFRLSRVRLALVATHPDATGGIGFLSDVQSKFGLVILAYGISNVAATVGYKVSVEGASWSLPSVWGPLVGFVIGAPLLFTAPLFMFTKQLYRAKRQARSRLFEEGTVRARAFEARWTTAMPSENLNTELAGWHQLRNLHEHIEKMRVVPFDLRSFGELLGQTLGALLPLVGYLNIPEPVVKAIEGGSRLLH